MKRSSVKQKAARPDISSNTSSSAGPAAIAVAPPAYGIDVLDSGAGLVIQPKPAVSPAALRQSFEEGSPLPSRTAGPFQNINQNIIQRRVFDVTGANQQLNTDDDIRDILGSFSAGDWTFPNQDAGDGRVGGLCVSQYRTKRPGAAQHELAVHVTFNIDQIFIPSSGDIGRGAQPRIEVHDLHLTVRPRDDQVQIAALGGAINMDQRQRSAHAGPGNNWTYKGEDELTGRICDALGGMPAAGRQAALDAVLDPVYASLGDSRDSLEERLRRKIKDNIRNPADEAYAARVEVRAGQNWA